MFYTLYCIYFLTYHYFYSSLLVERAFYLKKGGENNGKKNYDSVHSQTIKQWQEHSRSHIR